MKQIFNSIIIAFSMYSKIPMPKVDWSKENMRYVMCFFPFIGAVIGGFVYLMFQLFQNTPFSHLFSTTIIVLIPFIITGGIHMDGMMDTVDARSSYQPRERKLEILKDPNSGAFAVITCVAYYFLTFAVWYDVSELEIPILAISFVLSRALSGLAIVTFPLAKNSGLAAMFSNEAKKQVTKIAMYIFIFLSSMGMLIIHWKLGMIGITASFLTFRYYRYMSVKEFGGITGDLAGYFLQLCELVTAFCVMIGGKLCG